MTNAFSVMNKIAPEWAWGGAMLALGVLKAYAILSEKNRMKHYAFLAALFMWSCVTISFIAATPLAVGTPVYSLITVTNAFIIWRNEGKQ